MAQTIIDLSKSSDWVLRANISKQARSYTDGIQTKYYPIPDFDLGITANARFIAVALLINYGRPTWYYGGYLSVNYKLPFATQLPGQLGAIDNPILRINKTTILEVNKISGASYRLNYSAPKWFRDVKIKVWQYVGVEFNFVDETLLDLQSKLNQLL